MAYRVLPLLVVICSACGISRAHATTQPSTEPAAPVPTEKADSACDCIAERDTLTDNWLGLGKELEDRGLSVALGLTQIYQQNLHGGQSTHRRAGRYAGSYDLEIEADLEKLVNLSGGRIYALGRGGWSDGIDASSVTSIFGANADAAGNLPIAVWQFYYEQAFFDRKVLIRAGKIDLTGAFECRGCKVAFDGNALANDETSQFINGSLVNNPTIPFPDPGLGMVIHVEPVDGWYLAAAAADANAKVTQTGFDTTFHGPSDFFGIYETGLLPKLPSANGPLQGAYRVGMWYDPQAKDRLDGDGTRRDDVGFYTSCDQMLWKENAKEDDSQGLGIFGRYGVADAALNEIKSFWSAGLQYQGLIPGRDKDVSGFGVGQGRLSREAEFTKSNETALEVYYNIEVTPWLHVSPDIQYIFNPGGDASVKDAVVIGVRAQMAF